MTRRQNALWLEEASIFRRREPWCRRSRLLWRGQTGRGRCASQSALAVIRTLWRVSREQWPNRCMAFPVTSPIALEGISRTTYGWLWSGSSELYAREFEAYTRARGDPEVKR